MLLSSLRAAAVLLALFSALTGVVYPLAITVSAQLLFPREANGSLVESGRKVVGSSLIGQAFDGARYFWGRPSATASVPYNAAASTGSNLGPTNPALATVVRERVAALRAAHPDQAQRPIPVDLVTASGSGLDPHVSPAAALFQVHRIAQARALTDQQVRGLVLQHIEGRSLGFLGEPRVNVLRLNVALDALAGGGT